MNLYLIEYRRAKPDYVVAESFGAAADLWYKKMAERWAHWSDPPDAVKLVCDHYSLFLPEAATKENSNGP